jgi:hypothetical protein
MATVPAETTNVNCVDARVVARLTLAVELVERNYAADPTLFSHRAYDAYGGFPARTIGFPTISKVFAAKMVAGLWFTTSTKCEPANLYSGASVRSAGVG